MFLSFCMRAFCCRNDAVNTLTGLHDNKEEGEDDDIIVYRVYRSSSATNGQNAVDSLKSHPFAPKTSKSEVFDFNNVNLSTTRKTRGNRSRHPTSNPEQENGAKEDVGGDTGDVIFDDADTLNVLDSF